MNTLTEAKDLFERRLKIAVEDEREHGPGVRVEFKSAHSANMTHAPVAMAFDFPADPDEGTVTVECNSVDATFSLDDRGARQEAFECLGLAYLGRFDLLKARQVLPETAAPRIPTDSE